MSEIRLTAEQIEAAKAAHRADGCDCGGYFYADGRCPDADFIVELANAHRAAQRRWGGVYQPDRCSVCATVRCDEMHVIPENDLVEHSADDDCHCGPTAEPVQRDDGSFGWVVIHHALDGRVGVASSE